MKSELQKRAEAAAERFGRARKPIVFEFAGVPKAGKTTTLSALQAFLKRCGFLVEVVVERASVCPIRDKKHSNFNVWTACTTLAQVLEKTHDFRIFTIDTSSGQSKNGGKRTAEIVADWALNVIEEHLREDILSIPKTEVVGFFKQKRCVPAAEVRPLLDKFNQVGSFAPREKVEHDKNRIQALPAVVIRNKSGDVLRLRRRERSDLNPLHEKVVIWAGGHVRKEDQANGDSMLRCALREVQEELRLSLDTHELILRGAVYSETNERTAQHVAIVYEWRAETDDVAVALSSAEFFERRGTSLSGSFVSLNDLARDVDSGKISEAWSVEIVRQLLAKGEYTFSETLF